MIFSSAGHCNARGTKNEDSGAVGINDRWEADETVKLRTRVNEILRSKGYNVTEDEPTESLREYLGRIVTGPASVVVEFHFDADDNASANGCSAFVMDDANASSQAFGKELTTAIHETIGVRVRDGGDGDGIEFESDSHRGRLGLVHKAGATALVEICFISNPDDMTKYDANFEPLCQALANVIGKYEDLIK